MKIVDKRKFIARILDLIVIISTIILMPKAIIFATIERGYKGYGGEYLIPIISLTLILIIETIYEENKEGVKANGRRKM